MNAWRWWVVSCGVLLSASGGREARAAGPGVPPAVAAPCNPGTNPCPPRQRIVFTTADAVSSLPSAEIWVMDADGRNAVRLTDDAFGDGLPSLSPDGRGKIAFDSNRFAGATTSDSDLFLMNADGTSDGEAFPTPLTLGSSASWSPDGRNIAFHRSASGTYGVRIAGRNEPGGPTTDSDVFVLNVDDFLAGGAGPVNLTYGLSTTPGVRGAWASDDADWSPDGGTIAFTSRIPGSGVASRVYVMDLGTGDVRTVTTGGVTAAAPNGVEERSPDWSPDGTRIAFARRPPENPAGAFEIWVVELATGAETRLTTNTTADLGPSWSPDGARIAFQSPRLAATDTSPPGQQVWTMNADGSDPRRLTSPPERHLFPNWGQVEVGPATSR